MAEAITASCQRIVDARRSLQNLFSSLPFASPQLEAELLLGHVLDRPRSWLHAWPERRLDPEQQTRLMALAERRAQGTPIAYLLGKREFWCHSFEVSEATLIPRPATETLIEIALEIIPPQASWSLADLGTGSGIIAATLASERPACQLIASDIAPATLEVAKRNFERLGLDNIRTAIGDWFDLRPLPKAPFDLIASNPPYVAEGDPHLHTGDPRFEPRQALVAGPEGMDHLLKIIARATTWLRPGGWLLLEHGHDQANATRLAMQRAGFEQVYTRVDLSGIDRVTYGCASIA